MELLELEKERENLQKELLSIGEILNGTLSVRFQKCGKPNCACKKKGHPGHGPHHSLSYYDASGKMVVRNYQPGTQLERIKQQIANYHQYKELNKKYIEVSTAITFIRNTQITTADSEEVVKKNSKKR